MDEQPQETNNTDALTTEEIDEISFDPRENDRMISIVQRHDGNYRGFCLKAGKLVQARAGDPNTVLTMLITHP